MPEDDLAKETQEAPEGRGRTQLGEKGQQDSPVDPRTERNSAGEGQGGGTSTRGDVDRCVPTAVYADEKCSLTTACSAGTSHAQEPELWRAADGAGALDCVHL